MRPAYPDLPDDLRRVLATGETIERRIEASADGEKQGHLVRIVPYRTRNKTIEGVVLTFMDAGAIA